MKMLTLIGGMLLAAALSGNEIAARQDFFRKITEKPALAQSFLQDKDPEHYGLNGSPTRVKRIFPPEGKAEKEMWQGSAQELTERLFALLDQEKFLQQIG